MHPVGETDDEAADAVRHDVERTSAVFVPAFDAEETIAGQGTVAREVVEQPPRGSSPSRPARSRRQRWGAPRPEPGSMVVCVVSGGNNDVSRYGEILERSLVHEGLKHYFLVEFPQEPGALRRFLDEVLGPDDDITLFEYVKRNNRETGPALVGIELADPADLAGLLARIETSPLRVTRLLPGSALYAFVSRPALLADGALPGPFAGANASSTRPAYSSAAPASTSAETTRGERLRSRKTSVTPCARSAARSSSTWSCVPCSGRRCRPGLVDEVDDAANEDPQGLRVAPGLDARRRGPSRRTRRSG